MLTNERGGYFLENLNSRYSGLFLMLDKEMFKIIDQIKCRSASYIMPDKDGLIIESKNWIEFLMDIKESYDNSDLGRYYEIKEFSDKIIIKFTKDDRYTLYAAIAGFSSHKKTDKWIRKEYQYDKKRGSSPSERYVYSAIKCKTKKRISIAVSKNEKSAIRNAKALLKYKKKNKKLKGIKDIVRQSLLDLTTENGILAGLPWFFQFWSRDELISLKALAAIDKKRAKRILFRNLNSISEDGRLPNQTFPLSDKTNADSIGWLFKRAEDLKELKPKEKQLLKNKLIYSIKQLTANYIKKDLIYNHPLETWMDTEWESDTRDGFRIEIQALFLNMLKLAYKLTSDMKYFEMEHRVAMLVKEKLWNGSWLADGLDDWTIRPNAFIAAYIYPDLLTKHEWVICFNSMLQKLWLNWGGLATIEKDSPLFCINHTGEIPQSYHRGDSWFWINNLAAIVLHRTDKKFFQGYIDKILSASQKEITTKGIIGQHAELSSSSRLKSEGCLAQAWSNAMFLEFLEEMK